MVQVEKKEGKYWKYKDVVNGFPYYILVEKDELGNVQQIIEKPDLKQISPTHLLSVHIIVNNPIENHYDHISGAIVWKEYPIKEGKEFNSRYFLSGAAWFVKNISGAILLN